MTDREGCIALNLVPGIGYSRFQMLSEWFGAPGQIFNHAVEEYEKLRNFGPLLSARLAEFDPETAVAAELELAERGDTEDPEHRLPAERPGRDTIWITTGTTTAASGQAVIGPETTA